VIAPPPVHVIGHGRPATCTSAAVLAAVAAGGTIRFHCGPRPVVIHLHHTARLRNDHPDVIIDGGDRVTLMGDGRHRLLYEDTCDPAQVWTTSHCQDQASPRLTVEHLTLAGGDASGQTFDGGGGGAIFDRGGHLRIIDSTFRDDRCDATGPDLGGGAVRVLSQYRGRAVQVTSSRFEHNACSNGGALSSIGVSWTIVGCTFLANRATGRGADPARPGTPGGGNGGAIADDGDTTHLTVGTSVLRANHATEGGGAIFFVSDDDTGTMSITDSTLAANPSDGFTTPGLPGIFYRSGPPPTIARTVLR
jgi:hypothetical protein